ncbi:uncharacterized protein DUF4262 [Kineococcus xinjiangensis]|uniref:Uncharacterized protein DUF4262 n=1 Tax=Kineococcus xinjiangensis TaxID=512762 RepID=A0A2S6IDE3_9ACTN|nr:DUF4262 domain-containing protein [Kineococcus xinjiangensis]PPK92193.1 uncharacterized protein DUF4262 [Kineococcus xinjiangensis]
MLSRIVQRLRRGRAAGSGCSCDCSGAEEWRRIIADHGWMVMAVPEGEGAPGFSHTVGLTERRLPEVIVYGLAPDVALQLLNDVAGRMAAGEEFADGQPIAGLLRGDHVLSLHDAIRLTDPLGAAFQLYGEEDVRVRQLAVPDREGRPPWDPRYAVPHLQPVLFDPPATGTFDPPATGRTCADGDHDLGDLDLDPHLGVLATGWVADGALPVLGVQHHDDGDWSFTDQVHDVDVEPARILCLHHLLDRDPSLAALMASLGAGWTAHRHALAAEWEVRPAGA